MNDRIYGFLNYVKNKDDTYEDPLSEKEVENIMKRFKAENTENRTKKIRYRKRRIIASAAIIAAMAVIVPASVYAYSRYSAHIEKTEKYQNTVTINPPVNTVSDNNDSEEKKKAERNYNFWRFTYLPDGMEEIGGKYHNYETGAGISAVLHDIPYNSSEIKYELNYSSDCENYELSDRTAMINYRLSYETEKDDPKVFGREAIIVFENADFYLTVYFTNGVAQEDVYKVIEGIELYPIDEETYEEYFGNLTDYCEQDEDESTVEESESDTWDRWIKSEQLSPDECSIYNVGEFADYTYSLHEKFRIKINNIEITDSFEGITTDGCGYETDFSCYSDENGNILPNKRIWYKYGDGITSLDEEICSVDMPYHIVKLSVTAENTGDETAEICICPDIRSFVSTGILSQFEEDLNCPEGYDSSEIGFYDSLLGEDSFNNGGHFSLYTEPENACQKNYVKVEAGESADFQICFLCSENKLNDLYMSFYYNGADSFRNGDPLFKLN